MKLFANRYLTANVLEFLLTETFKKTYQRQFFSVTMPKSAIVVCVDDREKRGMGVALDLPKFKKLKARVQWTRMHSGDIRIIHQGVDGKRRTLVAIERKSADDLLHSSVEGRLQEQKQRLVKEKGTRVLYLIEGSPSFHVQKRWRQRGGAAVNVERLSNELVREDGMLVLRTESPQRTWREVEKWVEKLSKEIKQDTDSSKSEMDDLIPTPLMGIKRAPPTAQSLLCSALAAVPGVRHALAKEIALEYETMSKFVNAATGDVLQGTEYSCNGKKYRLGEVVAKRVEKSFDL